MRFRFNNRSFSDKHIYPGQGVLPGSKRANYFCYNKYLKRFKVLEIDSLQFFGNFINSFLLLAFLRNILKILQYLHCFFHFWP
jgi:hypothetical protein